MNKKRKIRNRWVHCSVEGHIPMLKRNPESQTTFCGKTTHRIRAVFNKNSVTCPRCIEKLKENDWYCEEHGFIQAVDVKNNETCAYCGKPV